MRFPLLPILTIVPLLNLAQASKFDSPLGAREYIAGLTTREFHDAADLQLRADILADLSTRDLINELSDRLERRVKGATQGKGVGSEPAIRYECRYCKLKVGNVLKLDEQEKEKVRNTPCRRDHKTELVIHDFIRQK
ncbi:hypothetical protein D9611_012346 [Ephemerocybe angulata]|uniref:Uncharacterized protein n=1 Tax=Ephemerocybe angulata TaxID=980116 RepID=A0A8H5FKM2_9AGAR|nr:hypothetical protein D9611_012346 [Tulosesus angulatus]